MRVDPERGRPTMNMGSAAGMPHPARAVMNVFVKISICWRVLYSMSLGR